MTVSNARRQVIVLDCCYSGAFNQGMNTDYREDSETKPNDLELKFGTTGRAVLTSCSKIESSFAPKGDELSIYTRSLIRGIREIGNNDADKRIKVSELHAYLKKEVKKIENRMSPKFYPVGNGSNIIIAQAIPSIIGAENQIAPNYQLSVGTDKVKKSFLEQIVATLFRWLWKWMQRIWNWFKSQQLYEKGSRFLQGEQFEKAIKCFNEAIDYNPAFAEAWYERGIAYTRLGIELTNSSTHFSSSDGSSGGDSPGGSGNGGSEGSDNSSPALIKLLIALDSCKTALELRRFLGMNLPASRLNKDIPFW